MWILRIICIGATVMSVGLAYQQAVSADGIFKDFPPALQFFFAVMLLFWPLTLYVAMTFDVRKVRAATDKEVVTGEFLYYGSRPRYLVMMVDGRRKRFNDIGGIRGLRLDEAFEKIHEGDSITIEKSVGHTNIIIGVRQEA